MAFDPKATEEEVLSFWKEKSIYKKAKEKNLGNQKFTYLDGPPYTSGKIHLGTAWGKSLRDSIMRFKRMNGFDVWDRAGFDMHGLPTENKVAAKFGFKTKEDILEYGLPEFQTECENFCQENMKIMIEDFKKLGIWMDFDNPYMPIKPEYMEGEWYLAKKAFENKRLYEGQRVMTWCSTCQTSLSKHELEYETIRDKSVFVKLHIKDNEYLVIWTTTPWTLPFNLAVMVNPEFDYIKAKIEDEIWIVAKGLAGAFFGSVIGKEFETIETFKGKELEGIKYTPPFESEVPELEKIKNEYEKAFTVLLSEEYVDLSGGSGLVHCAPGCGPEDYEVGKRNGLPAFNMIDESGIFSEKMGKFANLKAKRDDHLFIEHLKNKGSLIEKTSVEHEYPHCWRCHNPVVFRSTNQWFFKIEDLKEKMIAFNDKINWVPKAAYNAFKSWLTNLRDNSITRQRFWGTPIPIWKCDSCGKIEVIGSILELKEKAGKLPQNFHKPWIDEITIPCKCGKEMKRIPDIFDVWIDAGSAGFICYGFPQDQETFKKWFPADLILEGKDQIRGWFNLLMVASTLAFDTPSFKNVYMHGFINDYRGIKMSKSLGNITDPFEVVEKYGVDVLRFYTIGAARAGQDMNYNPEDPKTRQRTLNIYWNLHNLLLETIENTKIKPTEPKATDIPERYILSRLNSTIKEVTELFEQFRLDEVPSKIEDFILDLSRTYIQFVREKLSTEDAKEVISTLHHALLEITKIFAPISPFITDKIYKSITKESAVEKEESVHLCNWPKANESLINKKLEEEVILATKFIQYALQAREKGVIGVRWPIKEIVIETKEKISDELVELIKNYVNCKEVIFTENWDKKEIDAKPDYKAMGPDFGKNTPLIIAEVSKMTLTREKITEGFNISIGDNSYNLESKHFQIEETVPEGWVASSGGVYISTETNKELISEGYFREVNRRVQNLRKNEGLKKNQRIKLYFSTEDNELLEMAKSWKENLKEKVGADEISFEPKEGTKEKVKDKIFEISLEILSANSS